MSGLSPLVSMNDTVFLMSCRSGSMKMSSPLTVRNSALADGDRGVGSVDGSNSPSMSGLKAAGTLSMPMRLSILVM